jgi:hypothetical protein
VNDLRNVWQNQARENQNMSLIQLREKLQHLHQRIRLRTGISAGSGLLILAFFVRNFFRTESVIERVGWGLTILGTLCVLLPVIYQNHRIMWSGNLAFNAGMTTCLSFYRSILLSYSHAIALLDRQQRIIGPRLLTDGGTLLLLAGLGALLIRPVQRYYQLLQAPGPPSLRPWIPFLILLVIWGASFITLRRRQKAWLQREFESLEALEKENR